MTADCDYCGLPLRTARAEGQQFCCYGCKVASAITNESGDVGRTQWQITRLGVAVFFTMNVMMFTLALWSWDVYDDALLASKPAGVLFELLRYASLLLALIVTVLLGLPILDNAIANLKHREITTDLLIFCGVIAALVHSIASVLTGGKHTYFDVACMVLVGVTFGRWLESMGKLKTTSIIRSLEKLLPDTVRRVRFSNNGADVQEEMIPLNKVEVGETIRVLPGERIPTDGTIQRGEAAVDERIITGESIPANKEPACHVYAGTLNEDGDLFIDVTAPPNGGALGRIADAATAAAVAKSKLQSTADRIASSFVPCVMLIAIVTLGIHSSLSGLGSGLMAALAVLLIACPCALGIATPLAVWSAMGRASLSGVLFRHGDALQQLARASVICFDKTGTLTTDDAAVDEFVVEENLVANDILRCALSLASSSTHVFSTAIREYALSQLEHPSTLLPEEITTQPGRGVFAKLTRIEDTVYLGSTTWMDEAGLKRSNQMNEAIALANGRPVTCIGWSGQVKGMFFFNERLRQEALQTTRDLQSSGFHVTVLTGDRSTRAAYLQQLLGVQVQAELLPEQKLKAIRDLRQRFGPVVMIGDGINDAPALTEADVGIAMGCGADVSRESADVCLLGNDLTQVGWAIELAKQTMRTVKQNLFWAFSYNCLGIVLAAFGALSPIWAAIAMVGSSLFVISNSIRLGKIESSGKNSPQASNDLAHPVIPVAT